MTTKQQAATDQAEALTKLRAWLTPGDTIHTILRHRSASGMSRSISPVIVQDDKPVDISYWAARATGWKIDRDNGGLKLQGAGMDMGFHLVYELSSCLFPGGFRCAGNETEGSLGFRRCPSNDHSNGLREYGSSIHHNDGGYALIQRWI